MNESKSITPPRFAAWPLRGFGLVFAWGFRRVVRWPKVFLVAAVAVGLGYLIGSQIDDAGRPSRALSIVLDRGVLTFGLPLITLLLAGEGFAFEVGSRTLVYHLVRPVSRRTVFLARFLAGWVPATIVGLLFLVVIVSSSGVAFTTRAWLSLPVTAGLTALSVGAIYYTLGALLKHGLVWGLVYTFVVEAMLSSVPGSMQKFSVMFHVRSLHHWMTQGVLPVVEAKRRGIVAGAMKAVEDSSPIEALTVLLGVAFAVLAFGAWRISRRDFALRD